MPWYAVQTRSLYEAKVSDRLTEARIENLYPTYQTRSKWSDREKLISRSLFPSYLFCRIDPFQRAAVAAIHGVYQLLGGRTPLEVPESEIAQVRLLMASPELLAPVVYQPRPGDQVEVIAGVFSGVTGSVERWKQQKNSAVQVTVRIPTLMAAATVQVDAECLRRISVARAA